MEKIIYESKGMPKKMKRCLSILMCIILLLGVVVLIMAFTAKEYSGWGGYQSGTNLYVSHSGGITDDQRTFLYIAGFLALIITGFLFDVLRSGKKCYLKICEDHVEGNVSYWRLSKSFHLTYGQIRELSSNSKGLMPVLIIRTDTGNNNPIFLDDPAKAEEIIRRLCGRR